MQSTHVIWASVCTVFGFLYHLLHAICLKGGSTSLCLNSLDWVSMPAIKLHVYLKQHTKREMSEKIAAAYWSTFLYCSCVINNTSFAVFKIEISSCSTCMSSCSFGERAMGKCTQDNSLSNGAFKCRFAGCFRKTIKYYFSAETSLIKHQPQRLSVFFSYPSFFAYHLETHRVSMNLMLSFEIHGCGIFQVKI